MVLRLLFVLLCALNIAAGAWLLLGQPYPRGSAPSDPGVPELRLLSELPESASVPVPAAAASSVPAGQPSTAADRECLALGPFATPLDLRSARQALGSDALRMRSRQEQTSQATGWWVYLPVAGSRAQALAVARQIGARHIDDYFVVSDGGPSSTISLGLFKDPANARKRQGDLVAAGFAARMTERTETVPEYWLDLVVADGRHFDWRQRIRAADVGSHSTACF